MFKSSMLNMHLTLPGQITYRLVFHSSGWCHLRICDALTSVFKYEVYLNKCQKDAR